MNRFSFYLTCAALLTAGYISADAATGVSRTLQNGRQTDFLKVTDAIKIAEPLATRANVKILPKIVNAPGDNVNSVWCVNKVDGKYYLYGMEDWKDGDEFGFFVPEGTYDFFAFGYTNNKEGVIFLTQENVVVDSSFPGIQFNSADAVYSTSISYKTPSGASVLPSVNTYRLDNIHMILYNGDFIFFGNNAFFEEAAPFVRSNFTSGKFGYVSLDFAATNEGMLNYVVPVNFTEGEIIAGASNWQTGEIEVAQTPVNIRKQEAEGDNDPYTFATYMAIQNGEWILTAGWGIFGEGYDAAKVGLWEPENYEGDIFPVAFPRGAVMKGYDSCINGLPVVRGENSLQQLGVNYAFENATVFGHSEASYYNANPRYSGNMMDVVYGNCAPSLFTAKYWDRVRFNFVGRYGEAMNIDSWYDYFSAENFQPTYTVTMWLNGDMLINDQVDYDDYEWEEEGLYKIEFTTDNVLIDGEVAGSTSGTLIFDTDSFEGIIPSVSVLSLIDKSSGKLTDRFSDKANAAVGVYAAGFQFEVSDILNYEDYLLTTPKEVKIEYAPMGSGEYEALEVTEFPDEFFYPGFGAYYEASLADVKLNSDNEWFDLRITVVTEQGASQTQEISPAFLISDTAGIHKVSKESDNSVIEYYNLQGQKISNPAEGEILIRRNGSKTEKVIL